MRGWRAWPPASPRPPPSPAASAALRRRLRLGEAAPAAVPGGATSVDALRALVQDLVHAHAEGMPALRDARAVDALARAMVDDARHLAVLQMWMETEQPDA
jgi:hypothetical protein